MEMFYQKLVYRIKGMNHNKNPHLIDFGVFLKQLTDCVPCTPKKCHKKKKNAISK